MPAMSSSTGGMPWSPQEAGRVRRCCRVQAGAHAPGAAEPVAADGYFLVVDRFQTPTSRARGRARLGHGVRGGVADLRRMRVADHRRGARAGRLPLTARARRAAARTPVLLVPPLAAPAICFDLRRGCSMAEHLVAAGHPTYLVDYGAIAFADRDLGLEHWVDDVLPTAIRAVERGRRRPAVQLGWCLGGIMSLLTLAATGAAGRARGASRARSTSRRSGSWRRSGPRATLTGGLARDLRSTGARRRPGAAREAGYQLRRSTSTSRSRGDRHAPRRPRLPRPDRGGRRTSWRTCIAYPGRTFGQLYHRFFRVNDLADGTSTSATTRDRPRRRAVPVLAVAGETDVLAPKGRSPPRLLLRVRPTCASRPRPAVTSAC